jgi:hypothetical protein
MGFTDVLKSVGYEPKASTAGDKLVHDGIYKLLLTKVENKPDNKWDDGQPNPQVTTEWKVVERLAGTDVPKSDYPDVRGYYSTSNELCHNRKKGIAKLLDGLKSVGVDATGPTDEETIEKLVSLVGSAEVYMKLFPDWRNVKDEGGNWSKKKKDENGVDIAPFQGHSFLTEKNALKMAATRIKKDGHPL